MSKKQAFSSVESIPTFLKMRDKILIIENDLTCAQHLSSYLKSHNIDVLVCPNGYTAQKEISCYYDLIILDHQLGDISGLDLLSRIDNPRECPPVILWSGACDVADQIRAWDSGMVIDIVQKPTSLTLLMALIKNRLASSKQLLIRQYETQIGELVLNLKSNMISCYGYVLPLSPKEFDFLSYLIKHQDSVVNKSIIMNHIYRDDINRTTCPGPKILDVVICKVREKIEVYDPHRLYITTVWARGYRMPKYPEIYISSQIFSMIFLSLISIYGNCIYVSHKLQQDKPSTIFEHIDLFLSYLIPSTSSEDNSVSEAHLSHNNHKISDVVDSSVPHAEAW